MLSSLLAATTVAPRRKLYNDRGICLGAQPHFYSVDIYGVPPGGQLWVALRVHWVWALMKLHWGGGVQKMTKKAENNITWLLGWCGWWAATGQGNGLRAECCVALGGQTQPLERGDISAQQGPGKEAGDRHGKCKGSGAGMDFAGGS